MLMETRRFEKQPGLVKMHKVATVLMWIPHYVLAAFDETLLLRGIKCKKARVMVQ